MKNPSNLYKAVVAIIIFILVLLTLAPAINFWVYNRQNVEQDTQQDPPVLGPIVDDGMTVVEE